MFLWVWGENQESPNEVPQTGASGHSSTICAESSALVHIRGLLQRDFSSHNVTLPACSPDEFCEYFFRVCLGILH